MASDWVIEAEGLSKMYRLYGNRRDRLRQAAISPICTLFAMERPQYFKPFWALKDVGFKVKRGETVGVVGRNGSGKSTLLQIICGILNHTGGMIRTNGRIAALLELGSGFNPEFTGRENVYVNGALLGLKKRQIDNRMDSIIEFAEIGEFLDQPIKTYSSGMYVRLAFSVITHVDADILVIDEALSVGDALFTQKCMRFLREFQKKGTVFFVSHDSGAVSALCDKALFLKQGQLIDAGATDDVLKSYLSSLYEDTQKVDGFNEVEDDKPQPPAEHPIDWRDMRSNFINSTNLRNDTEVITLPPFSYNERDFGTGDARVVSVKIMDAKGTPYSWVVGGEDVILEIRCKVYRDIENMILAFAFKDRLGQILFGDNTYISHHLTPPKVVVGQEIVGKFEFRLPLLPTGEYTVDVMISEVNGNNQIQHHWAHDALLLKAHASAIAMGIVGLPMRNISICVE